MGIESSKSGKRLRVHVRFTTHCFSKKYDEATHPVTEPILYDAGRRRRSFCPVRYDLSLRLPDLILGLNHLKAEVMQTAEERNWLHSVTLDDPAGKYQIFFELRRAPPASSALQDLNLMVESAYLQEPATDRRAVRGRMGFVLLCGKVYLGEPVATRR